MLGNSIAYRLMVELIIFIFDFFTGFGLEMRGIHDQKQHRN